MTAKRRRELFRLAERLIWDHPDARLLAQEFPARPDPALPARLWRYRRVDEFYHENFRPDWSAAFVNVGTEARKRGRKPNPQNEKAFDLWGRGIRGLEFYAGICPEYTAYNHARRRRFRDRIHAAIRRHDP